jgi:chromosomal replication initiation ATPase DnaA
VRALFERQLARRGVVAPPDVLEWLVARIERSHLAIERSIDALDEGVMERQRRLTIPLARNTLIDAGLLVPQQELP